MAGNVFEWVNDLYGSSYYSSSPQNNPPGPTTGTYRVVRGGHSYNYSNLCRASNRNYYTPTNANFFIGFRVARTP